MSEFIDQWKDSLLRPKVVSINKCSEIMGIGRTKTYELINDGKLELADYAGRRTLITMASVDALVSRSVKKAER